MGFNSGFKGLNSSPFILRCFHSVVRIFSHSNFNAKTCVPDKGFNLVYLQGIGIRNPTYWYSILWHANNYLIFDIKIHSNDKQFPPEFTKTFFPTACNQILDIYAVASKCSRNHFLSEKQKAVRSFKLHFLPFGPFVQLYTSASYCKGVGNIPGSHIMKSFSAPSSHS